MPLENFYILHSQTGDCVYEQNYHGAAVPISSVSGLLSCMTSAIQHANAASAAKRASQQAAQLAHQQAQQDDQKHSSAQQHNKDALDPSASLSRTSVGTLTLNSYKFVFLAHSSHTLIAQGNAEESEQFLSLYVTDVWELLQAYLGPSAGIPVDQQHTQKLSLPSLKDLTDLIHHLLSKYTLDASYLCGGVRFLSGIGDGTRGQLDRLMTHIEEQTNDANGQSEVEGSILLVGNSIVHSRLASATNRMLLHHLSCRPLPSGTKSLTLPLFLRNTWHQYLITRLRHNSVLVCSLVLGGDAQRVTNAMNEFEEELSEAGFNLPIDEPQNTLRQYTGHDTIAFLYHHHSSGIAVAPLPRNNASAQSNVVASNTASMSGKLMLESATSQQAELMKTMQVFNWFYARANQLLTKSCACDVTLHLKGYRFYGQHEVDHSIYVLYTESVPAQSITSYTKEILENVQRHNTAINTATEDGGWMVQY